MDKWKQCKTNAAKIVFHHTCLSTKLLSEGLTMDTGLV